MNHEEYLEFHKQMCDRMIEITAAKNADYGGCDGDAFFNLTRVERLGITTTELGILTRFTDKLARITTFTHKGKLLVKDETIEDTILDACNYLLLLAGYIKSCKSDEGKSKNSNEIPGRD